MSAAAIDFWFDFVFGAPTSGGALAPSRRF